jgi:hypothetical protein
MQAAKFHDDALSHAPEHFMPSAKDSAARLAELEAMASDAAGEYYTGADATELQREHLALLEQQNSLESVAAIAGEKTPEARLEQLDRMQAEGDVDYFSNESMKDEHAQLAAEAGPAEGDTQNE